MECNKDEAIRAKTIAEKKLGDKDFAGAKKFAMKAQTLYPGLDGLSQIFIILEVYISAENKVSGEVDWYGILGVNPSDDDETIKKQYRKLALTLHPDKNKSVGADGAFKLLSEAWSLLSDKSKRLAYNQRRSSRGFQQRVPTQSAGPSAASGMNGFHNFTNRSTSKPKTQKNTTATQMSPPVDCPPSFRRTDTFWTICHRCKMHYEYLKVYLNHTLLCPNCHEPFLASEMAPPVNFPKSSYSSARAQHPNSTNHTRSGNPFDPGRNPATTQNSGVGPSIPRSFNDHKNNQSFTGGTEPSIAAKAANVIQQVNERLKRERENSYAGGSLKKQKIDGEGHLYGGRMPHQMAAGNGGASMGSGLRKSGYETNRVFGFPGFDSKFYMQKELSVFENRSMLIHKAQVAIRRKLSQWSSEKMEGRRDEKDKKLMTSNSHDPNRNGESSMTKSTGQTAVRKKAEAVAMNVPDPDFYDFDRDRTESSFEDNQVWAGYDDDDGMPRFYAMIHKVLSRIPFRIKISWLRARTNDEFGPLPWVASGFAKTCGVFRCGRHEMNKSINSFSHKVQWVKSPRGEVLVLPRKGDVWALYRNWSHDWNEQTPDDVLHTYEMVEVLDDYNEENGVSVTPLVKVTGFRTVFHRHLDPKKGKRIPKEEMFQFSHQVPRYLLTGEEAQNVPNGCLELDPAATPLELLQATTMEAYEVPNTGNRATKVKGEEMVENCEEMKERAANQLSGEAAQVS